MARAFIIRPFGTKKDSSGAEIDFERVDRELIRPSLEAVNLGGGTTGEIVDAGNIREDMFGLIFEADVVVCDITILNANVFYELGIRHALRKKCTVMIKGQPTKDGTPFDLLTDRYLPYDVGNPGASKGKLIATLNASLKSDAGDGQPHLSDASVPPRGGPLEGADRAGRLQGGGQPCTGRQVERLAETSVRGDLQPAFSVGGPQACRHRPVGPEGLGGCTGELGDDSRDVSGRY